MDPASLHRLMRGLYAGDVPLEICRDAAFELTPPRTWSEWLIETRTVNRLAELMACFGGHAAPITQYWLRNIGAPSLAAEIMWADYQRFYESFGLPAVLVEVPDYSDRFIWHAPCWDVARAAVRAVLEHEPKGPAPRELAACVAPQVRQHHGRSSTFRVRVREQSAEFSLRSRGQS